MTQIAQTLKVSKRWFFWPAAFAIVALGRLGILKDQQAAGKWLATHAMRIEVI